MRNRRSVSGAFWAPRIGDFNSLQCSASVDAIVHDIILGRGVSADEIETFLSPLIKNLLPDPFHLLGMAEAVQRVVVALKSRESVAIFADYDVDGATSAGILSNYLSAIGINSFVYVPDRIDEGYGPNSRAMLDLKERGASLCITVDCGIVAYEPIAVAQDAGLDVIIIDHHIGASVLPNAVAIVNPNRFDETSSFSYIAAVGVTFLFLIALNKTLREMGHFSIVSEPDLRRSLDLVAVGTICDMVPLVGLNRAFVSSGLKVLNQRPNLGLKALIDKCASESDSVTVYDVGFKIGPCINAGGRIGNAKLGASLFTNFDKKKCSSIALELYSLNEERKLINETSLSEAMIQAEEQVLRGQNFITVVGEWHPGVIGILASKIKDAFFLPVVVISSLGEPMKASARSVSPVNIGELVLEARELGIIIEGGGHSAAAGFSVKGSNVYAIHQFMIDKTIGVKIEKVLKFDAILDPDIVSRFLLDEISVIGPFGMGNPSPKFVLQKPRFARMSLIKGKHVLCDLVTPSGCIFPCICFNAVALKLKDALFSSSEIEAVLVSLSKYYKDENVVQIIIEDVLC